MSTINTLIDRRNQLLSETQRMVLAGGITAETRAKFDQMTADVELIEKQIEMETRAARVVPASEAIRQNPGATITPAADVKTEQRNALKSYIMTGYVAPEHRQHLAPAERRDIGTFTGSPNNANISVNGGVLVPTAFDNILHESRKSWGEILNLVAQKTTDTGAPLRFANYDDTSNGLVVLGEGNTTSETDPSLGGATSSTDFCTTGVVKVSIAELQDSAFDIDALLRDSLMKRYLRGFSGFVVNGSSTGNVQSLLSLFGASTGNTLNLSIAGGYAAGNVSYVDLWQLIGQLDPAWAPNARFAMHNTYRMQVMNIVDNYGRPIFVVGGAGQASVQGGGFDSILGYPVHTVQQLVPTSTAAAVGQVPVIFGDFQSAYTARSVRDSLSIVRLNELYLAQGEIGFTLFARVG